MKLMSFHLFRGDSLSSSHFFTHSVSRSRFSYLSCLIHPVLSIQSYQSSHGKFMAESWPSHCHVMARSWPCHGPVMDESWLSHDQVLSIQSYPSKSWPCHGQVMAESWPSHGKVIAKSWQNHDRVKAKLWPSHSQVMTKTWPSYQSKSHLFYLFHTEAHLNSEIGKLEIDFIVLFMFLAFTFTVFWILFFPKLQLILGCPGKIMC